jgi:hypothetical protein
VELRFFHQGHLSKDPKTAAEKYHPKRYDISPHRFHDRRHAPADHTPLLPEALLEVGNNIRFLSGEEE